jgi:hypothetical protein
VHEIKTLKLGELVLTVYLLASRALPLAQHSVQNGSGNGKAGLDWCMYYATLPASMEHMPAYWSPQHRAAIEDTDVGGWIQRQAEEYRYEFDFLRRAGPTDFTKEFSFEFFLWARCIVSSRSFRLPDPESGEETLFLIPVIDMLNHSTDPTRPGHAKYFMKSGLVHVVLTNDAPAGTEVTISYSRSSKDLLVLYGFVPPDNNSVQTEGFIELSLPNNPDASTNDTTGSSHKYRKYKRDLWKAVSYITSTSPTAANTGDADSTAAVAIRVTLSILDCACALSLLRLIVANNDECALLQRQGVRVATAYDIISPLSVRNEELALALLGTSMRDSLMRCRGCVQRVAAVAAGAAGAAGAGAAGAAGAAGELSAPRRAETTAGEIAVTRACGIDEGHTAVGGEVQIIGGEAAVYEHWMRVAAVSLQVTAEGCMD